MEHGSIQRELHIEAAPEVVYQVISTPEHLRRWWPDEADIEPVPGATARSRSATGPRWLRSPCWTVSGWSTPRPPAGNAATK